MKINSTILVVGALLGVGVVAGAYQLAQYGEDRAAAVTVQTASNGAEPASPYRKVALLPDDGKQAAATGAPRFSHFRVGNRNVKSMFADGKYVWVGTSGGVIRYDTETDDYQLFNNKNSGLLSNGIFHISRLDEQMAIGTYGGGLALLNPATDEWSTINIPQGLADQFVYDVIKAKNGDVWIATWSGAN
ncbi:MAG: two-component regulator propeller domain-containing protein, partial [Pseudomonadota bacterium]|nr:two-component regulator propeller domain-containing protein [Pseudomonadota bacterium]